MRRVRVCDSMQGEYEYLCSAPIGKNFAASFRPDFTPKQMLALGVFGGVYMRDCYNEYPKDWFRSAKLQKPGRLDHDPALNYFGVNASQPLSEWRRKGWIYKDDPRGWFQWYCRYYMGRRLPGEDDRQIKRWKAFARHAAQVARNCMPGDMSCRRVQRQALLHWAYDSRRL